MDDFQYDHDADAELIKKINAKEICSVCHKQLDESVYSEEEESAVCSSECLDIAYRSRYPRYHDGEL
ncbi:hypothetical protein ACWMTA_004349 [Escherichia coli]